MKPCQKNNITPVKLFKLETFPFIQQEYFDAANEWQMFCKLGEKINEIINFCNNNLETKMNEYFERKFNEIMIDTMYEPETETLVLYLNERS